MLISPQSMHVCAQEKRTVCASYVGRGWSVTGVEQRLGDALW